MNEETKIFRSDLITKCDKYLNGEIKEKDFEDYAWNLITEEHFDWDDDVISDIIYQWDSPEINFPITKTNIRLWKNQLETDENLLADYNLWNVHIDRQKEICEKYKSKWNYFKTNNGIKASSIGTSLETFNLYSPITSHSVALGYHNWNGLTLGVGGLQFKSKLKNRTVTLGVQANVQNSSNMLEKQPVENDNLGFMADVSFIQKVKRWTHRTDFVGKFEDKRGSLKWDSIGLTTIQSTAAINHTTEYFLSQNNSIKGAVGGTIYSGKMNLFGSDLQIDQSSFNGGLTLMQKKAKYTIWNGLKVQAFASDIVTKSSSTWLEYTNLLSLLRRSSVSMSFKNSLALIDGKKLSYLPQVALKWRKNRFLGKVHLGRFLNRLSNELEIGPFWVLDSTSSRNVVSHSVFTSVDYIRRRSKIQFYVNYKNWDQYSIAGNSLSDALIMRLSATKRKNHWSVSGSYEMTPYASGKANFLLPVHKLALSFRYSYLQDYAKRKGRVEKTKVNYALSASARYRSSQRVIFNNELSEQRTKGNIYFDLHADYFPKKWLVKGNKRFTISLAARNIAAAKTLSLASNKNRFSFLWE